MKRIRPARTLLLPLLFALPVALPSGAQEAIPDRFMFADTTLLRDTLGLRFDRLFPLADSLRMLPDSLRAIAVRFGFPPLRLVQMADSLGIRVDSVGPYFERERSNPLATGEPRATTFHYRSTYAVQQTRATWGNTSDFSLSWHPWFLRNTTTMQFDRLQTAARTSQRQTRTATTELGWRITPDYSAGGRAVLSRFDSNDPSSISRIGETRDEYQFSVRTRQRPSNGIQSEFNVFAGTLDLNNSLQKKQGFNADLNGRFRHASGEWFLHEITGQLTNSLARTLVQRTGLRQNTNDHAGDVTGTLALFQESSFGLNSNYNYAQSRVGAPDELGTIQNIETSSASADVSTRFRLPGDGTMNLTQQFAFSDQVTALTGPSNRSTRVLLGDGRMTLAGCALETRFRSEDSRGETPQATESGGFGEGVIGRSVEAALARRLSGKLRIRLVGNIGLSRYRYRTIGDYGTLPVSRDQAQQSYRIESQYALSQDFTSGLVLDVARNQSVNIPSSSTASNNTQRVYRAEWRWTYRLLAGLTATQRNTLGATYTAYTFVRENDRVALDYGTSTTLNAVLTPRLTVDLTHVSNVQPSGNYLRQADGLDYLLPADENRAYSLNARISYVPVSGLSLVVEPFYRASEREGTSGGTSTLQRRNESLNFQGSANLNVRVGARGLLSGAIGRTTLADRTTTLAAGGLQPLPVTRSDYWNGSLQFTWRL